MLRVAPETSSVRERAEAIVADTSRERFQQNLDREVFFRAMPEVFPYSGIIYVAVPETEDRIAKIGLTTGSARARVSSVGTGFWAKTKLSAVVIVSGAELRTVEKVAHQVASTKGERLNGEWFALSGDEALDAVIEACKRAGARAMSIEQAWWDGVLNFRNEPIEPDDERRRSVLRLKLGMD